MASLVLLNTYYCRMPGRLRPPEAIGLFSTPIVRWVARGVSMWFDGLAFQRLYAWQGAVLPGPRGPGEVRTAAL